MEETKRCISSE